MRPVMHVLIPKHKEMILVMQLNMYALGIISFKGRTPVPIRQNKMPIPPQNKPNVDHTWPMVLLTNVVGTVSFFLSIIHNTIPVIVP